MPHNTDGSSRPHCHVVVIGAGIGGLAAAIGIAKAGHRVTILEKVAELREVGAGIHVPPNATRIWQRWGMLGPLEAMGHLSAGMHIVSWKGQTLLERQTPPRPKDSTTPPYLQMHRVDYQEALVEEAHRCGVTIHLGCEVTGIDFDTPSVKIKGRDDIMADLIIGADGLYSPCREMLLGRPEHARLTGDLAYRITLNTEDILRDPLITDIVEQHLTMAWVGPDTYAVGYPLRDSTIFNLAIASPDNLPELVHTAAADLQELHDLFRDWDPKLRALLKLCKSTVKWRLQTNETLQTWLHPAGKFTLLGDACHAMLPYLGQGAATAVEDGAVLALLMEKLESKAQLKDVLIMYETLRKERTDKIVKWSMEEGEMACLHDGERQQWRDRELKKKSCAGWPLMMGDPVIQAWLHNYDADAEVDKIWKAYKKGDM